MFHYVIESLYPKNPLLSDLVKMMTSCSDTHSPKALSALLGSDGDCFLYQGAPHTSSHHCFKGFHSPGYLENKRICNSLERRMTELLN